MKGSKKVRVLVGGLFLALSSLVAGCGVDVDVNDNEGRCGYGQYYCSYSNSCRPYDGCCGDCCGRACNNTSVDVGVDAPGVDVDVDVN